MSLTDRDRKIVLVIVPVLFCCLLVPGALAQARGVREGWRKLPAARKAAESLEGQSGQAGGLSQQFEEDYVEMIRLGKAVPPTLDMPSLIVQLDEAARSTGIKFVSITRGEASSSRFHGGPRVGRTPARAARARRPRTPSRAWTPHSRRHRPRIPPPPRPRRPPRDPPPADGSVPPAGDEPSPLRRPGSTIPLVLTFNGGYFALTDLLHRFKRFVRVVNDQVVVKGRLMTVDGIAFEAVDRGAERDRERERLRGAQGAGRDSGCDAQRAPRCASRGSDRRDRQRTPPTAAVTQ